MAQQSSMQEERTQDRPRLLLVAPFDSARVSDLESVFDVTQLEAQPDGSSLAERDIDNLLADTDALVCELDYVDQATLAKAPNLRVVVVCRANPVNVDVEACRDRGIEVLSTPGRNADVTADMAFALLLMTLRKAGQAERWLRSGAWGPHDVHEPYALFRGLGLAGRTLGVLGGGAIGRRMVSRARVFGMDVVVYDPFLDQEAVANEARLLSLDDVLRSCDVLTVHVPLNSATTGMIGDRELRLMKPQAYLINAGRAAVVDEDALVSALQDGRLAGAGMDVFWQEPLPSDHPLLDIDTVTLTPHIAGASDDVITVHSRMATDALTAWLNGDQSTKER